MSLAAQLLVASFSSMSSSAAASAYWRVAGMSYLKYAGLCSDMVRAALVPELRAKARTREVVYYRESVWKDGAPEKQTIVDIVPEEAADQLKK